MKKRKLVITQEQFKRLNEAEQDNYNLTASLGTGGVPEINKTLDNPDFKRAQEVTGLAPKFIPSTYKGPNASPTVEVQSDGAGNVTSLPAGTPPDAAILVKNMSGSTNAGNAIMEESYTKGAVEKMRVAKIMENGERYTKKQVNESILPQGVELSDEEKSELIEFCRTNDFIARIIKPTPLFGRDTVCANISNIRNSFLSDLYNPNTKMFFVETNIPRNVDDDARPVRVLVYVQEKTGIKTELKLDEEYIIFWESDDV